MWCWRDGDPAGERVTGGAATPLDDGAETVIYLDDSDVEEEVMKRGAAASVSASVAPRDAEGGTSKAADG